MDYNQLSYYRANPYFRHGYMPPIAHLNRKQPQFLTEIPQGDKHLHQSGRKHFNQLKFKNNIQQQGILASPERYPYENRIAMDKSYLRSLNTIDIEGASSSTLKSQAVRNKIKAQQQLLRKNKDGLNASYDKYRLFEKGQEQRRRQLALQQYERNKKLNTLIQARDKYRPDQQTQIFAAHRRNNSMPSKQTEDRNRQIKNNQIKQQKMRQEVIHENIEQKQQNTQRNYERDYNNNIQQQGNYYQQPYNPQQYSRGQQYAGKYQNERQNNQQHRSQKQEAIDEYYRNQNQNYQKNSNQRYANEQSPTQIYRTVDISQSKNIKRNWTPRRMQKRLSISGPVPKDYVPTYSTIDKKDHRKYNPTNISELGQSFNLAARNIIGS